MEKKCGQPFPKEGWQFATLWGYIVTDGWFRGLVAPNKKNPENETASCRIKKARITNQTSKNTIILFWYRYNHICNFLYLFFQIYAACSLRHFIGRTEMNIWFKINWVLCRENSSSHAWPWERRNFVGKENKAFEHRKFIAFCLVKRIRCPKSRNCIWRCTLRLFEEVLTGISKIDLQWCSI